MSKVNVAEVAGKLFALLEPLQSDERHRVIDATLVLLGESHGPAKGEHLHKQPVAGNGGVPVPAASAAASSSVEFFAQKDPRSRVEEFAVAARHREIHEHAAVHTKADLRAALISARRNFDERNFLRDFDKAQAKGFFNRGHEQRGHYTLAYYGQQYVDALPDRSRAKSLRKPRGRSHKRSKNQSVKRAA